MRVCFHLKEFNQEARDGHNYARRTPCLDQDPAKIKLVGKALYKGRTYYVRYVGETKKGYSARLVTLDQSLDFWAKCAQPHETQHNGVGGRGGSGQDLCSTSGRERSLDPDGIHDLGVYPEVHCQPKESR